MPLAKGMMRIEPRRSTGLVEWRIIVKERCSDAIIINPPYEVISVSLICDF
jgi:hypothetical protein